MEVLQSVIAHKSDACIRGWLIEELAQGVKFIIGTLNNSSSGPLAALLICAWVALG